MFEGWHRLIRCRGPELKLVQDLRRRTGIDRKARANDGAGRVVDLVDQAGGELDELPCFLDGMRVCLHVKIGEHAQQGRSDIDALAAGERHQSIEARKQR